MAAQTISAEMQAQYEKALARAEAEGYYVSNCAPSFYIVTNGTSDHEYIVRRHGRALDCTCPAGQHDHYCKHRATVRRWVEHNRAATQAMNESLTYCTEQNAIFSASADELDRQEREAEQDKLLEDAKRYKEGSKAEREQWLIEHNTCVTCGAHLDSFLTDYCASCIAERAKTRNPDW